MEVLNNPEKEGDFLTAMNKFLSSNVTAVQGLLQNRKAQQTVSKSISAETFDPYIQKIGRINSLLKKTQEQDKRDREQFEIAFQRSRLWVLTFRKHKDSQHSKREVFLEEFLCRSYSYVQK